MRSKHIFVIVLLMLTASKAQASWLSEITGIDIDLNRGTISLKPPNLGAIPQMIQNLPKDAGQVLLNPAAPVVATAIRFSRGQALNRGVKPIPPEVRQVLEPYFPPQILDTARWTTAGGISIDAALNNWFNQEGAIVYDDVIVFAHAQLTINNVELWAHELTHVLQYSQVGVETFAFHYSFNWNALESQARSNADRIVASINASQNGLARSWGYEGQPVTASQRPTWDAMNQAAQITLICNDPRGCETTLGSGVRVESPGAELKAKITCTLDNDIDEETVKPCTSYLGDSYKLIFSVASDFIDGDTSEDEFNGYLVSTDDERIYACNKLKAIGNDKEAGKKFSDRCIIKARNDIMQIIELAKTEKVIKLNKSRDPNNGRVERVSIAVVKDSIDASGVDIDISREIIKAVEKVMSENLGSVDRPTLLSAIGIFKRFLKDMKGATQADINIGKDSKGRVYIIRGVVGKDHKIKVIFGVYYLV